MKQTNYKIEAKFICLQDEAFYSLLEELYIRLKGKEEERWISGEDVMRRLNISSPATLQKLRDTVLRTSRVSKKIILYDRLSVEEYLESKSRKAAWH